MNKILSFLSKKIRCPSPFTKELLADDHKLIKPTFSRATKGVYGTILNQPFLIQFCLLMEDKIPKSGEELTWGERAFIKNVLPVYNRYLARKRRGSFMNFSFMASYKKIEKCSNTFSLWKLDYFLFQHVFEGVKSILIMSYQNEKHYIGVSEFNMIEFHDSLQFFKVKTFKPNQRSDWVRAIKACVINWALPNTDLGCITLQLMWLVNKSREKVLGQMCRNYR